MGIENFYVHSVSVINPGTKSDNRGNSIPDWTNATTTMAMGWMAQSNASASDDEIAGNRNGTLTTWRLFLPTSIAISNRSRVEYGGMTFEVVGAPHTAVTPAGPHHLEVPLRLMEG